VEDVPADEPPVLSRVHFKGWAQTYLDSDAKPWIPSELVSVREMRHRRLRNVREYGMFERREAAQYYPDARPEQER
jgi:hypothetical protein